MGRGRKGTGILGRLFNAITGTGTTITRKKDFWGNKKTIVHNYDTGTTKEYTHDKGFFGNRTDVNVYHDGKQIAKGHIKKDFLGRDVEKLDYEHGRVKKSVKKMNCGFLGNHDNTVHYDKSGRVLEEKKGRRGMIFGTYTEEHKFICSCCNGTGIFQRTGEKCRKCGGTGVYHKNR